MSRYRDVVQERAQAPYQVRFAWGTLGATRVAKDAHLLVWTDVFPTSDRRAVAAMLPEGPEVVFAHLGNASDVARRAIELQEQLGDRCIIAVVAAGIEEGPVGGDAAAAAGESDGDASTPDFAVEDMLAAGGVIDALLAVGIDNTSPEAAAACAAYTGLRRAIRHLVTASTSARMLAAAGYEHQIAAALSAGPGLIVARPYASRGQRVRD